VFAPFVSRLKAVPEDSSVVLTWRDSPDVSGVNVIYRYTEDITETNLAKAEQIARVPMDKGSYVDFPPDTDPYFYAVLVEPTPGNVYTVFIPFRNKTLTPVRIEVVGSPTLLAANVTDITVERTAEGIVIGFETDKPQRDLVLYRSDEPMESLEDLVGAVSWLLDPGTTSYLDLPPAGIGYYYAVLDAELVQLGKVGLVRGENSSPYPVEMPLESPAPEALGAGPEAPIGRGAEGTGAAETGGQGGRAAAAADEDGESTDEEGGRRRKLPLPYLSLSREIRSGDELKPTIYLPETVELDDETRKAVADLASRYPAPERPRMDVAVLDIDGTVTSGGEQYILKSILDRYLTAGQYRRAEAELENFLSVHRSREIETRAHFYLAQSYYFQRRYRTALIEFLMAHEAYYTDVTPWIDACFEHLTE